MVVKMYAIRDAALGAFMQPFFAQTDALAMRSFGEAVMKAETPFHKYPESFDVFFIAEFDDISGECLSAPRRVGGALDFLPKQEV